MPSTKPISLPAGFAPAFAIGFSDQSGELAIVDTGKPLPVSLPTDTPIAVQPVSPVAPAPLEGEASADTLAGPFVPVAGKPVVLTLGGSWEGSVQVERSTDAGATRHGLTAAGNPWGNYTGNACEIVWAEEEACAELYLDIVIASGTLEYRIAQ
jgi:hypothetical protein